MSEQVDIAVDLGAAPAGLPEIVSLAEFYAQVAPPPPEFIQGILHQGCKMILGGTSKSKKSWCLLDLMDEFEALCRSTGAAVIVAHHFGKGDSTAKEAGDRLSGAGRRRRRSGRRSQVS